MKYRDFEKWCNDRITDGYWDYEAAMFCVNLIDTLRNYNFFKRNKIWKTHYERYVSRYVVRPINIKISKLKEKNK